MANSTARSIPRPHIGLLNVITQALLIALSLLLAASIAFFTVHAAHLLAYPYPLDYGEGPLLAQINALRQGTSLAALYNDPAASPYHVVNYPPVYHLATLLFAALVGDTLLAGRLVSLLATLGTVVALFALAVGKPQATGGKQPRYFSILNSQFSVLLFLALPIVREWAVVMRVDMLGLCLGLWGLVVVQRGVGGGWVLWAMPLLLLSLFTKPSLIAAPVAAVLWLLVRDWRCGVLLALTLALGSGTLAALLHVASGGWFLVHVVAANSNEWQWMLAWQFWRDQMLIHGPLVAAALLIVWRRTTNDKRRTTKETFLPLLYTAFGIVTAIGVGKVGAYANYFLEMYAGLIWLITLTPSPLHPFTPSPPRPLITALVIIGIVRYYPTWSENYVKLAGILEPNPARIVVGGYGVWRDLQREAEILRTLGGVNAALTNEVRAASAPIVTDVPGVAAQANAVTRLQAFEHRQLVDTDAWDQRPLLRDLANGQVPLVVLDYLGNWLTPEVVTIIQHRYAQDGSRGTNDLYRAVNPGPRTPIDTALSVGLRLTGYHLASPPGTVSYHPGELVTLTLELTTDNRRPTTDDGQADVIVQVLDDSQGVIAESTQLLLYGALSLNGWDHQVMQHMQTVRLPDDVPPGHYELAVMLRARNGALAPPHIITSVSVGLGGRVLVNRGTGEARSFFVPASFMTVWEQAGGDALLGEPLTPAVSFAAYTQQCFARGCLRLRGATVERVALGEIVRLGETAAGAHTSGELRGTFADFWQAQGGAAVLGQPISGEFVRGDNIAQYTQFARLERPIAGGVVRLARLGDEFLRLPPWEPYRWP